MTTGGDGWFVFRSWFRDGSGPATTLLVVARSSDGASRTAKAVAAKSPIPLSFVGLESIGPVTAWEGPPPPARLEQRIPNGPRVIT